MVCISDGSDDVLRSRIEDAIYLSEKRHSPCFLGFLDEREQAAARTMLPHLIGHDRYSFYGGYSEAERCILSVYPAFYDIEEYEYPLRTVAFCYRAQKKLTHRDVLGTLMSVGIRRDAIGDILCGDGISVVFLRNDITDYVCEQVDRIGGEGVRTIADYSGELPICIAYEAIQDTIASPRLDSVIKALIRCSREKAAELIRFGAVSVNHRPIEVVSATVTTEDTVSVRGYGRYIIRQIGPETKKGRLLLFADKRL